MPQRAGSWKETRAAEDASIRAAAADAMPDWINAQGPWALFATYTWDPYRAPPPRSADQVQSEVSRWLDRVAKDRGNSLRALTFSEPHRAGFWHGHGLLALPGGLLQGDIRYLHRSWFERKGYCRFEQPRSDGDVSRYLAKYLVKERAEWSIYPGPSPHLNVGLWSTEASAVNSSA